MKMKEATGNVWRDPAFELPEAGQYVDFLPVGTNLPTGGQFDRGKFCSRWADYEVSRVAPGASFRNLRATGWNRSGRSFVDDRKPWHFVK